MLMTRGLHLRSLPTTGKRHPAARQRLLTLAQTLGRRLLTSASFSAVFPKFQVGSAEPYERC